MQVGHTGVYDAAVEAVGHCDQAIGTIYEGCKKLGYVLFVTADHGYHPTNALLIGEMPRKWYLMMERVLILLIL